MKAKLTIYFLRSMSIFPLKALWRFATVLGSLNWLFASRMVKVTKRNIDLCFPELGEEERKQLAKQSIQETFKTGFEMGPIWLWPPEDLLSIIEEVEGLDILKAAYAQNKGVIVIAPHIGNWELTGLYLSICGCGPVSVMYQPPKAAILNEFIYQARVRGGIKLAATDTRGVAKVLAALRKGELVGILPDQVPPRSGGEYAQFFGREALTMTLLQRLLNKTGARAVFIYASRIDGPQRPGFKLVFKEADSKIYAEHMLEAVQAMNDGIEEIAREVPAQYQWEYKRFKRQPKGKPSVY